MFKSKVHEALMGSMRKMPHVPEHEELPEHVTKMSEGGYACLHCGGAVGEDGQSESGDEEMGESQEEELDEQDYKARDSYGKAMRGGK